MSSELLGIGTSSLKALSRTLETIGHNISNANNPDYNRQITDLSARLPIKSGSGFTGTGVQIVGTRRVLDDYMLASVRQNTSLTNNLAASSEYAKHIDRILGDENTGISQALGDFFSAIEELNANPNSMPTRQLFLSKCGVLQSRFNDLYDKGIAENNNINSQIKYTIEQVNAITSSIADINVKILSFTNGDSLKLPNDLLDQRDGLINDLASLVDVTTTKQDDGSVNVFVGKGQSLVMSGVSNVLNTRNNPNDSSKLDVVIAVNDSFQDVTNNISGGRLGGTISSRDLVVKSTLNSLGRLAISIANVMNQQHQKGLDINGFFGEKLFTNYNDVSLSVQRTAPSITNTGNGIINLSINEMNISNNGYNTVFSDGEVFHSSGTLNYLNLSNALSINGINIRSTLMSDDLVSTSDNQASSIATVNAINDSFLHHGIKAHAEPNTVFLGNFLAGAISVNQLSINNIDIVSTGNNLERILIDINAQKNLTGVEATVDDNNRVVLVAMDGRNIQLATDGSSLGAGFSSFSLSTGANDVVQRGMVKLLNEQGNIILSGINPSSVGFSTGQYPPQETSLTTSDYLLSYNGHDYFLKRLIDNQIVGQSTTPHFKVDGFTVSLQSGVLNAGDVYQLYPTRAASKQFALKIFEPEKVALAMPIRAQSNTSNQGDANIAVYSINNAHGSLSGSIGEYGNAFTQNKTLNPPIKIEFLSETEYIIIDSTIGAGGQIGPVQIYHSNLDKNIIFPIGGVINSHQPGVLPNYEFDPGYRLTISGAPKKGDIFSIDYNLDAQGDNRNGMLLSELKDKKLMSSNNATFQESYIQLVGSIANETSTLKINLQASESLLTSIKERKDNYSGVNLDEEAAHLLKFEQAYAASAHLISTSRNLFDMLMNTFAR